MAEHIPDHVERGLRWLPVQLREKPKLEALMRVILAQVQQLEDALYALSTERDLASAVGAQLDQLGALVGQDRSGMSDADYRLSIRLRIERNVSRGEPERLIRVLRQLTGATDIELTEPSPGVVRMQFDGTTVPTGLHSTMERCAPVGVRLELIHTMPGAFVFSSVASPNGPPGGLGFDEGPLSKII